jgi:hypothetical protein
MGSGAIVGIIAVVALAGVVTLFLLMGGASRFTQAPAAAGSPNNTTNVTVPAPAQAQPAAAPQINVPSSIDLNVKQPAAAAPPAPPAS